MSETLHTEDHDVIITAVICHEADRILCLCDGDSMLENKHWNETTQSRRDDAINNVKHRLENPNDKPKTKRESLFFAIVDALNPQSHE